MGIVETYITVHDQDLLLECERSGQFAQLSSHTYLFVGHRPVDRIPADVKVIVARDYEPNMEHLPQFYDYTGWHVLAKHKLIKARYAIFLQYDMHINDEQLEVSCVARLAKRPGMIAFTAGHRLANNFMLLIPGFEADYRRGLAVKGVNMDAWPDFNEWPSTQGTAWRTELFNHYMGWFEPLFDVFAPSVWAGHLAERCVKAFSAISYKEQYLVGAITHHAQDCHGTGALMRGDHGLYESRNAEFMNQSS